MLPELTLWFSESLKFSGLDLSTCSPPVSLQEMTVVRLCVVIASYLFMHWQLGLTLISFDRFSLEIPRIKQT